MALLLMVALGAISCSNAAQPAAAKPTVAPTSVPGDDASTSTSGADAPTPTADASPDPDAGLVNEDLAGIFELEAGEQVEDEQGNLVAIYGVSTWPAAYAALDPFEDDNIELFGGLEQEWDQPGALVALDVGICSPGVTEEPAGGSAEFYVSASANTALPTDRSTSGSSNSRIPVVEPALRFPDIAECSRGWLPVAWEGGADPAVARYLLSVRSPGASGTERYLYQWQITPGSLPDRDEGFGTDELVTFNDGDLAGTTVTFRGWAEFVGSESPIEGTRIVGISLDVCPVGDAWPEFGLAVDGWNLASQLSPANRLGAEAGDSADCYDGWLEFVVPLGGVPTGLFATDGVDPVAGFAGWSLTDAALATP